jgi:rubrerythrin
MNMVDLMWLFCGAFIGGLITLFFTAMLNASHEKTELEQARRKIEALQEDKRALRIALESPTSPEKGGYTDKVKLLRQGEKAIKTGRTGKKTCAICGMEYENSLNCPHCGSTATSAMLKELERVNGTDSSRGTAN